MMTSSDRWGCGMKVKLYDYQQTALDFCMKRLYTEGKLGAGLFLDPGLGKTLITLALMERLRDLGEVQNVLLVAPLRVCKLVWGQEIAKWGFDFDTNMLCQRVKAGLKQTAFIDLMNPESLHHLEKECHRWDMIVIDESTKFKNWSSKRTRMLRKMIPNFDKRLELTGTPAPNSLADLHAQMYMLDNGEALGRNVTVFRSIYMRQGGWQGRQWMLRENQQDAIQEKVAPICLRLDAETCLDMPELVVNDVYCELPPKCVTQYKQLKKELLAQLETGNILAQNAASAYMKMKQFANGRMYDSERKVHLVHTEKQEMLYDLVDELGGKPVLLFYQFAHDLEAIKKKYPKAPVLNGKTTSAEAEKMVKDFNDGKVRVFPVQVQAASHGLNLQNACNDVIYYGLNDSLEIYDQSFRRVYRNGVTGYQVRIHRLLTRGTVDEVILSRLQCKDQTQRQFLNALKSHASS